jgi:hypothetical protein
MRLGGQPGHSLKPDLLAGRGWHLGRKDAATSDRALGRPENTVADIVKRHLSMRIMTRATGFNVGPRS